MRHHVIRGLAAALLAGAATAGEIAAQDAAPDYAPYTATAFIPFDPDMSNARMPFTERVVLSFRVEGRSGTLRATMDTGTTGVVISADLLPPFDTADAPPGSEFLSSSNVLWTGHWVTQDLVFLGPDGPVATARVPVLAMQSEITCPGYKVSFGTACPESARVAHGEDSVRFCGHQPPRPCYYSPRHVRDLVYMGVGFGRE
ncbi:MAG TPA: hypothetical protein VGX50_12165, partial [Longimicrobium sp.]|nr:hypothetical protein [Longimicrobium sp.]